MRYDIDPRVTLITYPLLREEELNTALLATVEAAALNMVVVIIDEYLFL
jgi:hypothetical protein